MAEETARKTLEQRQQMTDLERVRHSAAHVLATAILRIWPDAQFAAGPPVDNGFYYDVDLAHRISPEDFPRIEEEMRKEVKANHPFQRLTVSRYEALELGTRGRLGALNERPERSKFKLDIIEGIPDHEEISLFQNGDFIDLCAGPHVARTGNVKAFKLTHVASAYYKGDEKNPQLQRIYGTAFRNKTEMDEYFAMLEEAKKRDHRKLGQELELFTFDAEYVGPGLPMWLPRGTVLIEELEKLARETEFEAGYQRVRTPHLAREKMYITSGHLPYYEDSMFPPMELADDSNAVNSDGTDNKESGSELEKRSSGNRYYLKAMNCPHHHKLFGAVPRSYRDLPLRLAEYGTCYRYEQSGELFGLMRVRSMQMNDAHIYCTQEQFEVEFNAVNQMYLKYFQIFGFEKYLMRFSTHDPGKLGQKFVGEPELWKKTEDMVRNVLVKSGINFVEVPNEAAFYGPKIDVQVWSAIGREFTIATNQVDFAVPKRFGLNYKTRENTQETPLCIHRAPLGTHERFIGFLIEHYAGNFPLWLAPEQVRVLPITNEAALQEYARSIQAELRSRGVRCELDSANDPIKAKIADAERLKVHTMLVIGNRDLEAGTVSVRIHGKGNLGAKSRSEVIADILAAIAQRWA
jgi:threonyl-tRNA synthetase